MDLMPTAFTCRMNYGGNYCGGRIVEERDRKFASLTPPLIGPGSAKQYAEVSMGYFCMKCGVSYRFLPQDGEAKAELEEVYRETVARLRKVKKQEQAKCREGERMRKKFAPLRFPKITKADPAVKNLHK